MATTTAPITTNGTRPILTEEILQACRERAAGYDRDNQFFDEDFEQLRSAGYTLMAVPEEFGLAIWTWPLNSGLIRSAQHCGAGTPF